MSRESDKRATTAAEMVSHVARLAQGEGHALGLTSAQWTALRYFDRANRFSRTVTAFADYHATTRGTASQTVKSLVTQGYLSRTRSSSDGRSARLDLTDKGRTLRVQDPFDALIDAIADLPPALQTQLTAALEHVMGRLADDRGKRPFGTCTACSYLEECVCRQPDDADHLCAFIGQPLADAELDEICINFEPGEGLSLKPSDGA
ncbi:MAG: MarR family winged helix-turn-helix transcriptional regulator [Methyloligellaceae bacterium]